jgi:hypothetical protein
MGTFVIRHTASVFELFLNFELGYRMAEFAPDAGLST